MRDECLNEHWFTTLRNTRETLGEGRHDYNTHRPHSSLNNLTPQQYAEQLQQGEAIEKQTQPLCMKGCPEGEGRSVCRERPKDIQRFRAVQNELREVWAGLIIIAMDNRGPTRIGIIDLGSSTVRLVIMAAILRLAEFLERGR